MSKDTRTKRRRKRTISAIAQRRLPLHLPAYPRKEYRLRDLIERLDLALNAHFVDRAVAVEAAAYLHEIYLAITENTRRGGAP
jgi:hypothetical protein